MKITPEEGLHRLAETDKRFIELFTHGTLCVEIYKPEKIDGQQPHTRDEIYVIIFGKGEFFLEGIVHFFRQGDFFFVPAGAEHRFQNFTADFVTWVFFFGPTGGEASNGQE